MSLEGLCYFADRTIGVLASSTVARSWASDIMSHEFVLSRNVSDEVIRFQITPACYEQCKQAKRVLSNALGIEEKYEILISNYILFKQEVFQKTTDFMVRNHQDYSDFFDVRLGLNIRLVNLLTSARLYIDQVPRNAKNILSSEGDALKTVKQYFSNEYDSNREYRLMEELRNYTQHRGLPVHWTTTRAQRASEGLIKYSMEIGAYRAILKEDSKLKANVLNEIGEKIDLVFASQKYIESISSVHEKIRVFIEREVDSSRSIIENVIANYREASEGGIVGLSAFRVDGDDLSDPIPLTLDWDEVRLQLQKSNRNLCNLSNRHVTS